MIMEPGQWLASKQVTSIPAISTFWFRGKICNLSYGIPMFIFTSLAVTEEQ